jgi:hypothetical protein
MPEYRTVCALCYWVSPKYPTQHMAGCAATWHVFEEHRDAWRALFGSMDPRDPKPPVF